MFPVTSVAQSGILLPTSFHRNDAIFHRNPSQGFFSSTKGDILGLILAEGVPVTQNPTGIVSAFLLKFFGLNTERGREFLDLFYSY